MSRGGQGFTRLHPLARLLGLSQARETGWGADELAPMLRHQLQAPLPEDWAAAPQPEEDAGSPPASTEGGALRSFADLFFRAEPSLHLLDLTRQFAKAHHSDSEGGLPPEISLMLYYASIAAALLRCKKRISKLDDVRLAEGFIWARDQQWIDSRMKQLFREGLAHIGR